MWCLVCGVRVALKWRESGEWRVAILKQEQGVCNLYCVKVLKERDDQGTRPTRRLAYHLTHSLFRLLSFVDGSHTAFSYICSRHLRRPIPSWPYRLHGAPAPSPPPPRWPVSHRLAPAPLAVSDPFPPSPITGLLTVDLSTP